MVMRRQAEAAKHDRIACQFVCQVEKCEEITTQRR
ncbi:hypothetical protein F441_02383 [Phytophthora nicotianae CJ01A1]|uniref:Uncharacterized protein n=6 Tax=Phytophthora nicotianae TaxID=4792 RepID=W2QPJ8_PHYN3|nr:hypothetical protein PPTG_22056 [Phytophthora nicotianae INRA-310]ETI54838.1 hypothetical protein F443_02432 [Phytophthora nicotianae P1569]ETK94698.1 hypothetical protein L915_02312 [Phytophthora nicotianae]ETO83601.1 hypothetical protein F444_02416 [Phytophthora nicotianae P1976]ETP24675.1 hypothetical protein F441_02383 [Phytophthora nicotianae CJ01A1]ETP52612.1 hypothetical protein F442_02400 [Phytophthora nicotianae P10297]